MRLTLLLILYVFGWVSTLAQQRPHYAQYVQNHFLINPALAGLESYADVRTGFRRQWAGLSGAPTTFYLTAHLPVGNDEFVVEPASARFSYGRRPAFVQPDPHAGVGISLVRDQAGAWGSLTANVAVAYHYPLNDDWQVSAALSGGLTQHTLDFDQIRLAQTQDPVVGQGKANTLRPDLHAGVWAYSSQFYGGFSVQQLWPSRLEFSTNYNWQGQRIPHYFLTLGYRLELLDDWEFVPSVLFKKAVQAPFSFDVNLKFNCANNYWVALSYRHRDALMAWAGVRLAQQFTVGYAYEYTVSALKNNTNGTHELTLGLTLGNRTHHASPRYFW